MGYRIGVDVGGTFTDFLVLDPARGHTRVLKLSSTPDDPAAAIAAGLASLLGRDGADPSEVTFVGHGTTVTTNAVVQRRGARSGLLTTAGFRDLLEIGRQRRPSLYDLRAEKPAPLIPRERRLEVDERVLADGRVARDLDEAGVRAAARRFRRDGVRAVAVCFLHAYANPAHERRALAILREELGDDVYVCASSGVLSEFREYERLSTTVLNAYLGPVLGGYLGRFRDHLGELGVRAAPYVALANGGLATPEVAEQRPLATALSGPAAGVAAAGALAAAAGIRDFIALDMGGTSTDVSLVRAGHPRRTSERELLGHPARFPALDIRTVGAGGGSIARVDPGGLLQVGPESAGARPGPACYDRGGERPTVTDAQVVLGRLPAERPLAGGLLLDARRARESIARHLAAPLDMDVERAARGVEEVAVARLVRAVWSITVERGTDPRRDALVAYGGAGPAHAAQVARRLGIETVLVPPAPGHFSAFGLLVQDLRFDFVQTRLLALEPAAPATAEANRVLAALRRRGEAVLDRQRVPAERRCLAFAADLRYAGQGYELTLPLREVPLAARSPAALAEDFHRAHDGAYGYAQPERPVELVNLRLAARGLMSRPEMPRRVAGTGPATPRERRSVVFGEQWLPTPVLRRGDLPAGWRAPGPALIEEPGAVTVVPPGARAEVGDRGLLRLRLGEVARPGPDPR